MKSLRCMTVDSPWVNLSYIFLYILSCFSIGFCIILEKNKKILKLKDLIDEAWIEGLILFLRGIFDE